MTDTTRMDPVPDEPAPPSKADVVQAMSTIRKSGQQEQGRQRQVRRRALAVAVVVAAVVALMMSAGTALLVFQDRSDRLAAEVDQARRQEVVSRSVAQLDDINRVLRAQGKPPIPAPADGEDSTGAIAKVVLGQVLTQLPPGPDAQRVGSAIAGRVTDNLLGTTRSQVAEQAAAYLSANPAAPGRPPTLAEIQAAVDVAYRARPPAPGKPGDPGADGTNGADGSNGAPGAPGRGIVGSEQEAPCTRLIRYDQPPLEERWNTCRPEEEQSPAPPDTPDSSVTPTN